MHRFADIRGYSHLSQVDKFVVYLVYCSNHSYITERLRQFKAIYPSFVQFTEVVATSGSHLF